MTKTQQLLLESLRCAVRGTHTHWDELTPEQWDELLELARRQKVLPLLVEAAYTSPAFSAVPEQMRGELRREVRRIVVRQTMQTQSLLKLMGELETTGFHALVVKGAVCRALYPMPDARPSADEDILIPAEEFSACAAFLRERGFYLTQTGQDDESEVYNFSAPDGLQIELHRTLFAEDSLALSGANDRFEQVFEDAVTMEIPGGSLKAMSPHDHMLYLILHAFKHLIYRGFGLRQVCDILLWARRYACEIDWKRLEEQCTSLRAWDFTLAVFALGESWLELDSPVNCACAYEVVPELLEDMLTGGVYGGEELSRKHSATLTVQAVEADRKGARASVLRSLFPARGALTERYPYLKHYPVLLPLAWLQRIVGYAAETGRGESRTAESLRIGRERTELLRKLNVID